jgi:hypothetical protein
VTVAAPQVFNVGDPEPDLPPGSLVAVHHRDYRRQEVWVSSALNIGCWYPLGGEFSRGPQVVDDPRTSLDQLSDVRWRQPTGTIPRHPHWDDVVARGPVTLLVTAPGDAYAAGWRTGRARLCEQLDELRELENQQ